MPLQSDERENIVIRFEADASQLKTELKQAADLSRRFSRTIASSFADAAFGGKSLSSTLRRLSRDLSELVLNAAFRSMGSSGGGSGPAGALGKIGAAFFSGFSGSPLGFSRGGILTGPNHFALPSGAVGVAGEAGPEAVLPLRRGVDGHLGVAASGAGGRRPVQVTFNIATPDVAGFRRSQGRIAAEMLRILDDGRRNM